MMPIQPICLSCVMNQCQNYLERFAPSPEVHIKTMQKVFGVISKVDLEQYNMPKLAAKLYALIDKECKLFDAYRSEKIEANAILIDAKPKIQQKIRSSKFPLLEALKLSAMGNIIDLGIHNHSFDIQDLVQDEQDLHFYIDHSDELLEELARSNHLVYVLDNAGEAVLDTILIEEIRQHYPDLKITAIVRGKPAINDVTLIEAKEIGLDLIVDELISTASSIPGISKGVYKKQDQAILDADVVLAKGLGNYESNPFERKIYHLFNVKCSAVSDYIKVPMGEIVLSSNLPTKQGVLREH